MLIEIEGRRLGEDTARLNTSLQAMQDWLKAAAAHQRAMRTKAALDCEGVNSPP